MTNEEAEVACGAGPPAATGCVAGRITQGHIRSGLCRERAILPRKVSAASRAALISELQRGLPLPFPALYSPGSSGAYRPGYQASQLWPLPIPTLLVPDIFTAN